MDNEKKSMKRNADWSDLTSDQTGTPPGPKNSSHTDSDHEVAQTANTDEGNDVVASPKSTATSDRESCHFYSHSSTNTGFDCSSQYQNPNGNYFGQWPWGENMEFNSGSDPVPLPPDFSPPSFDFCYYPRSRYAVPGEPSTLITITTNADATNTAPTRTPLSSVDSVSASVSVPVPTQNPKSVSASASVDIQKQMRKKEGGENGAMLAGVEVKGQDNRNQTQPDSTTCKAAVAVARTASSSSSGHSIAVTGPAGTLVNTSTSDLVPGSITFAKKPCTNAKKEPIKLEPVSRPLIKRPRYVKHGFDRLYDSLTDATGNFIEFSCIVGRCTFGTNIYSEFQNHLAEKHLKSSELTGKLVLFTSITYNPLSTEGQEKTKFVCNFLGCEKKITSSTRKSHHVTNNHLEKRNFCLGENCHDKFLYNEQLHIHLRTCKNYNKEYNN